MRWRAEAKRLSVLWRTLKPLRYHPEALEELVRAPGYYQDHDLMEQADELEAEILQALHELQAAPKLHPEVMPGLRAWRPTKKFGWRVGYTERGKEIVILATYHPAGHEDPLYWIDRDLL